MENHMVHILKDASHFVQPVLDALEALRARQVRLVDRA